MPPLLHWVIAEPAGAAAPALVRIARSGDRGVVAARARFRLRSPVETLAME
jgi:hypothetical protein